MPGPIGETIDFFRVRPSTPDAYKYELLQSAISLGFDDKPETLAFLEYIASTPAQTSLASPVANKDVAPEAYPSAVLQEIAAVYVNSGEAEFAAGPNLLNGAATGSEYDKGVVSCMQDPSTLDQVLATTT